MKLGLSYMVFTGEELLPFACSAIRSQVDYISVTYQTKSYFGNPCDPGLIPLLEKLKSNKLIDEMVHYEHDSFLSPKENELRLRNLGLELSRNMDCTYHISSDVDEFYLSEQIDCAKKEIRDYDFSLVPFVNYYKDPCYLVPKQKNLFVSFIHPVSNSYEINPNFPFRIEITRKMKNCDKYKVFSSDEVLMHHMTYVRKNIRTKFENSCNKNHQDIEELCRNHELHKLGDKVCIIPDYINHKTVKVENRFGIYF